jgi:SAM-dependent methyltransferase
MSESMQSWDPRGAPVTTLQEMAAALLPLREAEILSLTAAPGDIAPGIAAMMKSAVVTVLETAGVTEDPPPLSNLIYKSGEADRLDEADESFDIVMVNGALSRTPEDRMPGVLREVRRVLRPGGLAYVLEPVFGGAFNEIQRVFLDEKQARLAAFEAIRDAVASGAMTLISQKFFQVPLALADFAMVEKGFVPPAHRISGAQRAEAQKKFDRHKGPKGAVFQVPMRVDLLQKSD